MNNITNQTVINIFYKLDPTWKLLEASGLSLNKLASDRQASFDIDAQSDNVKNIILNSEIKNINYLANKYNIDIKLLNAIKKAESGKISDTLIIRFEIHIFDKYLKQYSPDKYKDFYKYFKHNSFKDHQWRKSEKDSFNILHTGSQKNEWDCYLFAKSLNIEAASSSISMGAFQIMGFNYKRCGFNSAEEMFNKLNKGYIYQEEAFVLFIESNNNLLQAIINKDFDDIAKYYNGTGQIALYSSIIRKLYDSTN